MRKGGEKDMMHKDGLEDVRMAEGQENTYK